MNIFMPDAQSVLSSIAEHKTIKQPLALREHCALRCDHSALGRS